jgi:hypothetical protein
MMAMQAEESAQMARTILAAALAAALAWAAPLVAAPSTLKGEVVDVQCALKDAKNTGADHTDCALSCARRGATMGILTVDGVYTITGDYTRENNKRLLEFVAQQVEATGEVIEKDGKRLIDVSDISISK